MRGARVAGLVALALLSLTASITPAHAQTRDICALLAAKPGWRDATESAASQWGVSAGTILAVIDQESRFNPVARGAGATGPNPERNFGFTQANIRTWSWFARSTGQSGPRSDFATSAQFVGWHFATMEPRIGQPRTSTVEHYLAYKMGEGGYRRGAPASARAVAVRVASRARAHDAALSSCTTP